MGFAENIAEAQKRGATPDQILEKVKLSNPGKSGVIDEALKRGASADVVLQKIMQQNAAPGAGAGFVADVQGVVERGAEKLGQIADIRDQSLASKALQTAGTAAKSVTDIGGAALKAGYKAFVPQGVQEKIAEAGTAALSSGAGQAAAGAVGGLMEKWNAIKAEHPEFAADVEAIIDIGSLIPAAKGASIAKEGVQTAGEAVVAGAKTAAKGAVKVAEKRAATKAASKLDDLADLVGPVLTKTEKEAAVREGRTITKGLTGEVRVMPSEDARDIARSVGEYVDPKKSLQKNVTELNRGIRQVSEKTVEPFLAKNTRGFNAKQITKKLENVKNEQPLHFTSEPAGTSTYDKVISTALESVEKQPKNAQGLWKARREFDKLVEERFPRAFDNPDATAMNRAIMNVRREMNNQIAELTPGTEFKDAMRKLNHMFDARDSIVEKGAKEIGTTRIGRYMKKHPIKGAAAKAALTGGAVAGGAAAWSKATQ